MAAQTAVYVQTATLTSTTADTVTFSGHSSTLSVTNHDASVNLFVRIDGTAAVTDADENYLVRPGQTLSLPFVGSTLHPISIVGNGNKYTAMII